ncbi:ACP S-malonyltransferase [Leifsonia sp. Leaf264]|uniref:ACP S-malonyltransferase n=1 Tax=Leifsonia sp. Leaf264 TaxID=1736314 RepID=UPI0006F319F3|nr:ACP S-malonyltransferase [Leifsonia sp. Leaf264]KQP01153.1 ACP S-malonyltransferase [Leifsonia sp. Leaf264]
MIVVVCPGQGSQTPGFLAPWLAVPENAALVAEYSEAAGLDLAAHGTTSDADTIRDTAVAQPLIVAAGLVTFNSLVNAAGRARIGGIAGHSVGEITAAAAAGILSPDDAMQFVSERAVAMAQAAAATPTSMSAVLGGDAAEVVAKAESFGLQAANYNGGGQIVVAGAADALARLADEPPGGARVIPLQVAGAFHTRYMEPARTWLSGAVDGYTTADPTIPIWTNNDGSRVESGARFLELLVTQVASPVRWDLTMESLAAAGVTGIIELAPAGALIGLARRGLKGIPSIGIKTPDDLDAAVALIEQNA